VRREMRSDRVQDGRQRVPSGRRAPKDLVKQKTTLHRQTLHLGCTKVTLQLLLTGTTGRPTWDAAKASLLLSFLPVPVSAQN